MFNEQPFAELLAETITWCAPLALDHDPKHALRSAHLQPWVLAPDRAWSVSYLSTLRRHAIAAARTASGPPDLRSGRLLVVFPELCLFDGAAEEVTRGYFDLGNAPPWDTWIALRHDPAADENHRAYLVAWVPPVFVELVDRGAEVSMLSAIRWLEDAPFARDKDFRRP